MAMKKLSVDLQCIITSSLQINNFKRVVEELVYNSLDAKATSIAVRINIAENKIQVVDNGCGITEADFDLLGNKHSTSKCVDLNTLKSVPHTYGFRGQFLANLINIAQKVKITSRFEKGEDTWVKIFYNGKERELAKTDTRPSVGTTVEVSDLFYNLHIQSKIMESLNELSEIKTLLKQLTLVHSNISISLRDDSKNEIIFKAHKNRNIYQTFRLLFNIDEKDIAEFKVEKKEYKVTAYFGKKDTEVGQYHWIYLNGKILNNCKLHKIVNDNLSKSCKHISKRKIKSKVCEEEDIFTTRTIPFYIILLSCPYYDYDINDMSKLTTLEFKNWEDITNLLQKLVNFYCGDDTLKKQLKNETVKTNCTKTEDDDKRDQVRRIVEKLLKSNSKKLGISQMQNGIKGKLTKRNKKKKKSFNISLSKVIPTKNKIPWNQNELSKDKSKKISSNDEIVPDSHKIKNVVNENIEKENDMQEEDQLITINNVSKHNLEYMDVESEETTKRQKKEHRNSNQKYNVSLKYSRRLKERYKTFRKLENKKRSRNKIPLVDDSIKVMSPSNDMCQSREMKLTKPDIIQSKHNKNYINYTGEKLLKQNDLNNIYNINTNNKQITIHKNIEEIIVYDYIPHPLNSTQQSDRHQNKFMKKPHISSRDLVKTVLNTQYNNVSTNENQISYHHKEGVDTKKSEIYFDFAKDLAASLDIKHNRMMNSKNTCESAFNAWKFDLQPDSNNMNKVADDELFISKITYESHHYNKNVCFDNSHKTKTKKFISKQSKDNFIVSKEKQKLKKSYNDKFKYLPKINFHDVNMTFGIKNFFKNRNFLQESSFMIEFSNSAVKDRSHEATYTRNSRNIFCTDNNQVNYTNSNKYMQKSDIDDDFVKGYSVNTNTEFKNTYTISENSLNPSGEYNPPCQNYESIRYTENVLQGTYTIETHNDEDLYLWKNNENKEDARNDKDELNVIFVSEPQIEIVELSADKIVEPIDVCETILNESSPKSLSDMEIDLNDDIAPQWSNLRQEQHIETPKISQREVSHHFNTSISNTNYTTAQNVLCNSYIGIDEKNNNLVDNNDIGNNDYTTIANNDNINFKSTIIDDRRNDGVFQNVSKETISNNFSIKIRPRYMPKGMSQIFENSNTKGVCDYNLDEDYYKCNIYEDFTKEIEINTEIFKPRVQNAKEDTTTHAIEKVNLKLHKEKSALTFDGQLLKQAQILEQVDGKFIAAIVKSKSESNDFLILFDQHAVHERIRLENNMADYFNEQVWRSVKLDVFVLKLSKEEILYLHNYKDKFTQLGLEWNILSDYEVSVFGIPEAILGKNPRQVDKVITAVKNLILEEINVIKSQGGCICLHPKSIMDLVFSEACRYAIKFGDKLTINDCRELIQSLSDCRTPFQCAHGRPVMAVLMEMTSCDVQEYKVDISKIRVFSETKRKQTVQDIQ